VRTGKRKGTRFPDFRLSPRLVDFDRVPEARRTITECRPAFSPACSIARSISRISLARDTDLGPDGVEVTGDAPEVGARVRPRLRLVLAEMAAAATADAHLDRARQARGRVLHDGALRDEASSRSRPRRLRAAAVATVGGALGKLEGRISHRAAGDGNGHVR